MTSTEIPIWVSGKQLWVTGVDRKTTVNDVIEALLGHSDKEHSITEKWRRVERPLNGDTKILKLWKTWGDARNEVKLSLKKMTPDNDSGRSSPASNRSNRRHKHKSTCSKHGQTVHPRRLAQLSKTQNIERLLKLILVQGETIQSQISRLKERELQIEELEGEQHKNRINILGSNYLLDTYLGHSSDVEDSGVATECAPSSENTSPVGDSNDIAVEDDVDTHLQGVRDRVHALEGIVKLNKQLEKEEEDLVRLYINIERCKKSDDIANELKSSLERLRGEHERCEREYADNAKLLFDIESTLRSRKCHLSMLQNEICDEGKRPLTCKYYSDSENRFCRLNSSDIVNLVSNYDYYSLPCKNESNGCELDGGSPKPPLDTLV